MIYSILDTDLYKFTTSYAYIKLFPYASGTFSFTDRDQTVCSDHFLAELKEAIDQMRRIALTGDELEYMTHLPIPAPCLLGMALFFPLPTRKGKCLAGRGTPSPHGSDGLYV